MPRRRFHYRRQREGRSATEVTMKREEVHFDVGGVRLARPFRIRRLGHFGVNVKEPRASQDFYCDLLGFRHLRPARLRPRLPRGAARQGRPDGRLFHAARHRPPFLRPLPERRVSGADEWATRSRRARSTRSPGRSARCARSSTASTGSQSSGSQIRRVGPRHARLELAHLLRPTPTATSTSSITASSRSAGTAFASRATCTTAPYASRRELPHIVRVRRSRGRRMAEGHRS